MSIEHNNGLLIRAAKIGDVDTVQRLIPLCNETYVTNALQWAAEKGHTKCVQLLIPVSDPKAYDSAALRSAANKGHTQCVEQLIPVSDPKVQNSAALQLAAANGHTKCVTQLIAVSDPKAQNSAALQWASRHGHTECVDALFDVSDPHVALGKLQRNFPNEPDTWCYLQKMVEAEHLRNTLNSELGTTTAVKVQRKL